MFSHEHSIFIGRLQVHFRFCLFECLWEKQQKSERNNQGQNLGCGYGQPDAVHAPKARQDSAKERKKVMSPEKYPIPYANMRIAEKILTPENRNPMPYSRMPQTAMVYTTLSLCAKKDTPIGANR